MEPEKIDKQLWVYERKRLKDRSLQPYHHNHRLWLKVQVTRIMHLLLFVRVLGHVQNTLSLILLYTRLSPTYKAYISKISYISIPNHVQNALTDSKWKFAMIEEMKTLHKNHT